MLSIYLGICFSVLFSGLSIKNKSIELNRRIIAVMSVIGICIATAIIFIDGGKYKVLNDVPRLFLGIYVCVCLYIH